MVFNVLFPWLINLLLQQIWQILRYRLCTCNHPQGKTVLCTSVWLLWLWAQPAAGQLLLPQTKGKEDWSSYLSFVTILYILPRTGFCLKTVDLSLTQVGQALSLFNEIQPSGLVHFKSTTTAHCSLTQAEDCWAQKGCGSLSVTTKYSIRTWLYKKQHYKLSFGSVLSR